MKMVDLCKWTKWEIIISVNLYDLIPVDVLFFKGVGSSFETLIPVGQNMLSKQLLGGGIHFNRLLVLIKSSSLLSLHY